MKRELFKWAALIAFVVMVIIASRMVLAIEALQAITIEHKIGR